MDYNENQQFNEHGGMPRKSPSFYENHQGQIPGNYLNPWGKAETPFREEGHQASPWGDNHPGMTHPYNAQGQPNMPGLNPGGFFSSMNRQLLIEDAIQIARAQVPGEVVSAELEREKGRLIFEIDIVSTQGPVYEVKVDALTGEVLSVELD